MPVYSETDLLAEHDYSRPQVIAGLRCHGGFDVRDAYLPPRTLVRPEAIAAWREQLESRGGSLLHADSSLLSGPRVPNPAQQRLLLQRGLGETFWNTLTITGKIEARGRVLADLRFPSFRSVIVEDVSGLSIGHLNKGLLRAHGLDEGGEPSKGIGGHDTMWFALRDLAFGAGAYPDVSPPERITRADPGRRLPELPPQIEGALSMLLNLLIIEFRAEIGFAFTEAVLMDPDLFIARRKQAQEAADVVRRIRLDEEIHIESLRLYLGELRACTFRTLDGSERPGSELIDPLWAGLVHWASVEQPLLVATQQREIMRERILRADDGAKILEEFEALATPIH